MNDMTGDEVFELALKLSIPEQARLLERVAANLAREVDTANPVFLEEDHLTDAELGDLLRSDRPKSGAEIATMIESGELNADAWSEMINPHITDPVEWLRALRGDMTHNRNLDWGRE
jgi:hypothetical protein